MILFSSGYGEELIDHIEDETISAFQKMMMKLASVRNSTPCCQSLGNSNNLFFDKRGAILHIFFVRESEELQIS